MNGYHVKLENKTLSNENFREVLYTAKNSQLVVMSLLPKEEIGMETHADHDQFIRIEKGAGKALIDSTEVDLKDGTAIVIPAGAAHNIWNVSESETMKLYTIYSPPEHPDKTIHKTKPN